MMNRPEESIYIKNFGGIEEALIPLNEINIFIGPQASGKSVTAKLVYFFKEIREKIYQNLEKINDFENIDIDIKINFYRYFPKRNWELTKDFLLEYRTRDGNLLVFKPTQYSEVVVKVDKILVESLYHTKNGINDERLLLYSRSQVFLPTGRSFFSNIQNNIFTILDNNQSIDPFLIKFGSIYEIYKKWNEFYNTYSLKILPPSEDLEDILKGEYIRKNNIDYIVHSDGREIELSYTSSGQQESLPIILLIRYYYNTPTLSDRLKDIYFEEPEANIYPESQRKIVGLLASLYNKPPVGLLNYTITTHSPYILTAFNNLIQAGAIEQEIEDKEDLYKIVPQHQILKPNTVNAYEFRDGKVESLIDPETGFILAERLDAVSEELAIQFDQLLDLKYAVEK